MPGRNIFKKFLTFCELYDILNLQKGKEIKDMWTHEYTDEKFETYDECSDDFRENMEAEDIVEHMEITLEDVIRQFLRRRNPTDFDVWFEEKIYEAIQATENELIYECDEDEEEEE